MTDRWDINNISQQAFAAIDSYVDNFQKIADIKSDIMYGDLMCCPAPVLSVVVPTFNRYHCLKDALNSAVSQKPTDFPWEVVVVDNTPLDEFGSTPALSAVREINSDKVVYYHNRQNLGSGYNWNRGVELSRGKWICFLHDDDLLCSDALANIGRMLKNGRCANKKLGYLNARRVDFNGEFAGHSSEDFGRYPQEKLTRFGMTICGHTSAGAPTCGTTILKKAYIDAGGINYDFGPSADAVLTYKIMKHYDAVNSDCVLGGYRWNENASLNKETIINFIIADDLIMQYVYSQSKFSAIWGKLFGASISWRNVHRKMVLVKREKVFISKSDFKKASMYREPCLLIKSIYLALYAGYRGIRLLGGQILGRR